MKYADTLSNQSMIDLDPSTRTELDYFKRRLSHNLYDLYLIVKKENIKLTHLDLKELEQYITPR